MGFKMKGSAFKLGEVKGTSGHASALKQTTVGPNYTGNDPNRADKYHPQYNYHTESIDESDPGYFRMRGKGKNRRFDMRGDEQGNNHQVSWIRDHYGRGLSKKEKKAAEIAYYNAYKPEEKGEAPTVRKDAMSEKSTTEEPMTTKEPMTKAIHETGEYNPSELNKSLRKGYFNKGEGSEYIATRPKPKDFGTFEEYQAALRKHEMDYPNVNHESP